MGNSGRVRSNAWIWDFSSTHRTNARSGGFRYSPTTSLTFSMKKGSADNLKVSVRWGCNPKARQMRLTVLWLSPLRWAMDRVLQWVASRGAVSSVSVITRSTSSSVTARGRPLRGSSDSPSSLRSRNRERHFPTVCFDTPNWTDTAVLFRPSAPLRMILARRAKACAVFGRRAHRARASRSSSSNVNGGSGRPMAISVLLMPVATSLSHDRTLLN